MLATSVWEVTSFSEEVVENMMAAGDNAVRVSLWDTDADRDSDQLSDVAKLFGYLRIADDDDDYPVAGNLLQNPGFEEQDGGNANNALHWWRYDNAGRNDWAGRGSAQGMAWWAWAVWYGGFGQNVDVDLDDGDVVVFTIWGNAETGFVSTTSKAWIQMEFWSGGSLVYAETNSIYSQLVGDYNTWTEYRFPYTNTVDNITEVRIGLHYADAAGYEDAAVRFDDATFVKGTHPLQVFIGSDDKTDPAPGVASHTITDHDLANLDSNPLRLVIEGYDLTTGLSRGTTDPDVNTHIHITGATTNNVADYWADGSSATTREYGDTNTWHWTTSFASATINAMLANVYNEVLITSRDSDFDREGDQLSRSNRLAGFLRVIDDDDEWPRAGNEPFRIMVGDDFLPTNLFRTAFIAGWNYNTSNTVPDHGTGTMTSNLTGTIQWLAGSSLNAVSGDDAGYAFAPTGTTNNYQYFQFQIDMSGQQGLILTYATRGTTTGYTNQQWSWSTDGINFTHHTTIPKEYTTNTTYTVQTVDFSDVPQLTGASEVYIRCTISGATGEAGNNRFDNIQFNAQQVVYELYDHQLANEEVRFIFNVYDTSSGIRRGTASDGYNMSISVDGWLTDNTTNYHADYSSAGTTTSGSTSTWRFVSVDTNIVGSLANGAERDVRATFTDDDFDRDGDNLEVSDRFFGIIRIVDNDTNKPLVGTGMLPGNLLRNSSFEWQHQDGTQYEALYWTYDVRSTFFTDGGYWGTASRESWASAYDGDYRGALRGLWATAGDNGGFWQQVTNAVGAGSVWEASAWVYNDASWAPDWQAIEIEWWDAGVSNVLDGTTNIFANPGQTWTHVSVLSTAPVGAVWARWVMRAVDVTDGALSIDHVSLRVVTNVHMDFMIGHQGFYREGHGTNAIFRVTDGDLMQISDTNLMKFIFNVYDPSSGLQRSSSYELLNFDIGNTFDQPNLAELQNIYWTYDASRSSADTKIGTSTSVFSHTEGFTRSHPGSPTQTGMVWELMAASTNAPIPIYLSAPDGDLDRPGDAEWMLNHQFGYLVVDDDDPNGPWHWLQYVGSNFTWGSYNTNPISDAEMLNFQFAYGIWDPSGILVTNHLSGSTNTSGEYGEIAPNWDLVNPSGLMLVEDAVPGPGEIFSPIGNRSFNATVVVQNVSAMVYDVNTVGVWRLQASAQDMDNDRGYFIRTNLNGGVEYVSWDRKEVSDQWMEFSVYDDDTAPPAVGGTPFWVKLGDTLITAESSRTNLIAGWNYNVTTNILVPNHGSGTMTHNFTAITNYSGTANNKYASDAAGQAFAVRAEVGLPNNGRYFQFQLDMGGLKDLVMTFAALRPTTGFTNNQVSWSTDGNDFTAFGSPFTPGTNSWIVYTNDFSAITDLNNKPAVYIRITVDGATGADGNIRIDNLLFRAKADSIELTDAQLATVSLANPLQFVFNVYDTGSGIARGTTVNGSNMTVSVTGWLTNNAANYDVTRSSADTKGSSSTSVWTWTSFTGEEITRMIGSTNRSVQITVADLDNDRPQDTMWLSNQLVGTIRFVDDDAIPPKPARAECPCSSATQRSSRFPNGAKRPRRPT
jgi:hypothetical protein